MIPAFVLLSVLPCLLAAASTEGVENVPAPSVNPASEIPTESRRLALETAGAFANDGFRIRDGEWSASLEKGKPLFLKVTLFAGNRYWFVAATPVPGTRLRITVYDPSGKPLKSEMWQQSDQHEGSRAAAGVAPEASGQYFVAMEAMETRGPGALEACLVAAYK